MDGGRQRQTSLEPSTTCEFITGHWRTTKLLRCMRKPFPTAGGQLASGNCHTGRNELRRRPGGLQNRTRGSVAFERRFNRTCASPPTAPGRHPASVPVFYRDGAQVERSVSRRQSPLHEWRRPTRTHLRRQRGLAELRRDLDRRRFACPGLLSSRSSGTSTRRRRVRWSALDGCLAG